jgi:hypothetical protein
MFISRNIFLLTGFLLFCILGLKGGGLMPPVKSLDRISEKWARQSSTAQPEYTAGIQNPRKDWAQATAQAESSYEKGVQTGIQEKRFSKGVKNAGTAKWQENALAKGSTRWAEGISLSKSAYVDGFSPYRTIIENLQLPVRGPKGDPANIQRVAAIATALHAEKKRRKAGK